jgi:hypothetical protein
MNEFTKIVLGVMVGLLLFPIFAAVVKATLAFALWIVVPLLVIALLSLAVALAWKWLSLPRAEFDRMLDALLN